MITFVKLVTLQFVLGFPTPSGVGELGAKRDWSSIDRPNESTLSSWSSIRTIIPALLASPIVQILNMEFNVLVGCDARQSAYLHLFATN